MFTVIIYINEFSMSETFNTLEEARDYVRKHPCDDYQITDGDKEYPAVAPTLN